MGVFVEIANAANAESVQSKSYRVLTPCSLTGDYTIRAEDGLGMF